MLDMALGGRVGFLLLRGSILAVYGHVPPSTGRRPVQSEEEASQ
jgi:hypothetical protein